MPDISSTAPDVISTATVQPQDCAKNIETSTNIASTTESTQNSAITTNNSILTKPVVDVPGKNSS